MNDASTPSHTEGDKSKKYPYIHPEDLRPPERLAVDADDVEDFIEHFSHHDQHEKSHKSERAKRLAEQAKKSMDGPTAEGS